MFFGRLGKTHQVHARHRILSWGLVRRNSEGSEKGDVGSLMCTA